MVSYKVTTEIRTSRWLKVLRFLRIKSKREEFEICFDKDLFRLGDIINNGSNDIKIIGK